MATIVVTSDSGTKATVVTATPANFTVDGALRGPIGPIGLQGQTGPVGATGPANTLTIGTVTQGTAAATITGTAPNQVLNLTLQKGDTGSTGATGPKGDKGDPGSSNVVVQDTAPSSPTDNLIWVKTI